MSTNFGRYAENMLTENQVIPGSDDVIISPSIQTNEFVDRLSYATAWVYLVGTSGQTGDVSLYFQRSPDGESWFDTPAQVIPLSGDTPVSSGEASIELDVRSTSFLRLNRVVNSNAGAVTINVEYTPQRVAGQA